MWVKTIQTVDEIKKIKGEKEIINQFIKEKKMSKLYETINSLDNYVLEDKKEEVTIDKFHIVYKNGLRLDLSNLKDKSVKLFYKDDDVIGYLYLDESDYININNNYFNGSDKDCDSDSINLIMIKYKNEEEIVCSVCWNSLFYPLDDEKYILLFMGNKDLV